MGFTDRVRQYYTDAYFRKYGDRLTQIQGNIVSAKVEEKSILWIFHKITASFVVKPIASKGVVRCVYKKNRWFKKPDFIAVSQGHSVIIQGLKGKKGKDNKDYIEIMNILNQTTKKDLVPVEGGHPKPQVKRTRYK